MDSEEMTSFSSFDNILNILNEKSLFALEMASSGGG